ncbi:MAG: hypothetical protein IJC26_06950 [Clostridia bacterium]|nr:hypothetical protein [Clostridia bacterium]
MKKILALFCLYTLLLPLVACSNGLSATDPEKTAEEIKTEAVTEEKKGEIVYPDSFAVGYARGEITGPLPMPYSGGDLTKVQDPLYLTCTSVWDGENLAFIMSADLLQITREVHVRLCQMLEKKYGVPEERVIISCTHTHTATTAGTARAEGARWLANFYRVFPKIVEESLRDLDVVEGAYAGKGEVEEGITFVRRYLMPDGSYKTHGNNTAVAHETEADRELRTVRFDRKNKKDVLMVNYQTHHGGAGSLYPDSVSADWIHPFRKHAEEKLDCLFSYQSGAEGNINFESPIPGERKYRNYNEAIPSFIKTTQDALNAEEKVELGKIVSAGTVVTATVLKDSPERIALAEQVSALGENDEAKRALCDQIGFDSKYEASGILKRNKELGDTEDVPLNCITFGDLAFAAFPFEQFDTSGKVVRDTSPFKMTFINGLSGGTYGYMPTKESFPHGGYEVVVCPYTPGCAEQFVEGMQKLLNDCKR